MVLALEASEPQLLSSMAVSPTEPNITLTSSPLSIWQAGVGNGFRPETWSLGLGAGAAYGLADFGSHLAHDLALVSLAYSHMLGPVQGQGHWYRGNWEWRVEGLTGAQYSPTSDWLIGLTPYLRYNFATGTRWVPFFEGGLGVTATSIGLPDLANVFEFNLQGGSGVHWFLKDNLALTVEARYIHLSCAGISQPNNGLNSVIGMLGWNWFF